MELIKTQRFDNINIQNQLVDKTKYEGCIFFNSKFSEVTWNKCHFHNTSFLHDTTFTKCKFIDCKFTGQHTNMGGPSEYNDCEFENVQFKNIQFWGATFIDCIMSGQAYNVLFYGNDAPKDWETIFNNVDIQKLQMEFVEFRDNFDLSKTIK